MIRTLLVDDEPLARARLRRLLGAHPDVTIVGEHGDGRSAGAAIRQGRPDLLFLDVEMPEMNAFKLLQALGQSRVPALVFVTAYAEYAALAFDTDAVDYLVKPFDAERLERALTRVRRLRAEKTMGPRLEALLEALPPVAPARSRLAVRSGERIDFVEIDAIDYCVSEGNYVCVHVAGRSYLVRETLTKMATELDSRRFLRIHRCRLVRIERVRSIAPLFHGEYRLILDDGTELSSARTYRHAVRSAFGIASRNEG